VNMDIFLELLPLILAGVAGAVIAVFSCRLGRRSAKRSEQIEQSHDANACPACDRAIKLIEQMELTSCRISRQLEAQLASLQRMIEQTGPHHAGLPGDANRPTGGNYASEPIRRQAILDLHAQGIEPVEIARRLGVDVGQVELVVNLSRTSRSTVDPI